MVTNFSSRKFLSSILSFPLINFFFICTLLTGCQTSEQIRRQRMVDELSDKMMESEKKLSTSQKFTGDLMLRVQNIENRLNQIQGTQEESKHFGQQSIEQMENRLLKLEEIVTELEKQRPQMENLSNQVKEQKKYLERVIQTLEAVQKNLQKGSSTSSSSSSKGKKKADNAEIHEQNEFEVANMQFKNGKYEEAKALYMKVLEQKSLSAANRNKVLHKLGIIEFQRKNKEEALVYFSKIYTKYPRSSLAPNSLLHIGKILQDLGKKEEAKEAFGSLVKNYPQSEGVQEAKGILNSLN